MKTIILNNTIEDIEKVGEIIRKDGLVAFPTETVYGLGANGLSERAVEKIYEAKGRPKDNPMILHIAKKDEIYNIAKDINENTEKLIKKFWPGPLTIVVKRKEVVPDITTGGLDTVAVRMPSEKVALDIIKAAGVPIAAPSANLSGKPSPTKTSHVIEDLDGRIEAIVAGGDCKIGIESTVVSAIGDEIIILRPGKITKEELQEIFGHNVYLDPALEGEIVKENFKPMAPGMKYKHYAPKADMLIIEGEGIAVEREIEKRREALEREGKKVGVIIFHENDYEKAAHDLFAELRDMDKKNVDFIIAGAVGRTDLGYAVMNRMLKSSGYNIIKV